MPNANYYRQQASLLLKWAMDASRPEVAERLTKRAQEMLELAQRTDAEAGAHTDALDIFNTAQMVAPVSENAGEK